MHIFSNDDFAQAILDTSGFALYPQTLQGRRGISGDYSSEIFVCERLTPKESHLSFYLKQMSFKDCKASVHKQSCRKCLLCLSHNHILGRFVLSKGVVVNSGNLRRSQ